MQTLDVLSLPLCFKGEKILCSVKLYLSTHWILIIQYDGSVKAEPSATTNKFDYTGSCKSNYHTITMAPKNLVGKSYFSNAIFVYDGI
jgi:hypothetical protein